MSTVLALGDAHELDGFALVGARVRKASTGQEVAAAWRDLPPEVGLVVLTARAADVLRDALDDHPDVLIAVLA